MKDLRSCCLVKNSKYYSVLPEVPFHTISLLNDVLRFTRELIDLRNFKFLGVQMVSNDLKLQCTI